MIERKWDGSRPQDIVRSRAGPEFRQAFAAAVVLAFTATPSAAFAASGETAGTVGTYQYPTQNGVCGRLRTNLQAKVDFTFACSANSANCEFTSASSGVQAPPLGFCQDALPNVRGVTLSASDTLEKAKTLQATTFGVNTDISTAAGPVDIVSSTFAASSNRTGRNAAQGVRASVQVKPCSGPQCDGPPSCAGFNIKRNASACTDVASQLALSFTGKAASGISISHAILFSAKQDVGKPGSQTVLVCPGYTWACGDPASADGAGGTTTVNAQVDYGILQTPGCAMTRSGYRCW
jgi:hypothetical protein